MSFLWDVYPPHLAETLDSEIATQNHVLVATEEFFFPKMVVYFLTKLIQYIIWENLMYKVEFGRYQFDHKD